ncbi:MAG: hypothetical protein M1327_06620 [Candidatus Thermoplasmatota archaeon]|nr:hypothetical protein [Candidatus Thermoplasmatota archaeon]
MSGSSKVLKNEQKVLKNEQKVLNRVAPSSSEILSEQPSNEQMSKKRAGTIIFDSDELLKLTNNEEYTAEQERLIREKELPNQIIDVSERLAKTTKPFIKKNTERIEPKNSKIGLGLLALILSLLFLLLFWNDIKNFISGFKKGSLVGSDFTIVRE